VVCADVYEGFDMADHNSAPLASNDTTRVGITSSGWNSTWQVTAGKSFVEATDLEIKGFDSVDGSLEVRGERKPNSIGQGVAMRLAELGSEPEQVGQYLHEEIKKFKRGLFGGMIVSCFSVGMPKVTFDEIRISQESLADTVGLSR